MMIKTKFVVISMFSRSVYLTSSSPYQFSISLSFCMSVFLSLSLFLTQAYTHIFPISLSPFLYISQVMMTLTERSQDKVKCSSKWLKTKQLAISFMPILSADFLLGTKVHINKKHSENADTSTSVTFDMWSWPSKGQERFDF